MGDIHRQDFNIYTAFNNVFRHNLYNAYGPSTNCPIIKLKPTRHVVAVNKSCYIFDPIFSSTESASVIVHVLSGERPAAMQSSGSTPPRLDRAVLIILTTITTAKPKFWLIVILPIVTQYISVVTLFIAIVFASFTNFVLKCNTNVSLR